ALGAVGERLADGAVHALALGVLALQDRNGAAEHGLADAVLGAALDPAGHAPLVEGAEALAGDAAAVEGQERELVVLRALGPAVIDPSAGDRAGELGAEHAVVRVGRARIFHAHAGPVEDPLGDSGELGRGLLRRHADRLRPDKPGLGAGL